MSRKRPGLYIHIPFCSAICPYCDFAVVTGDHARRKRYVDHLLRELDARRELTGFDTLYWGGGTPSLLDGDDLHRIRERSELAPDCRVFLEANPEDVDVDMVARWRELGVATLSLGVQSFDDGELSFLGRRHSSNDARAAFELARRAGFETVSIDLIFGLPGQTLAQWRTMLDMTLELAPDHISCYQLTVHDKTLFGRRQRQGRLVEADEATRADLFRESHERLGEAGFIGYEVSNFARDDSHRSKHNEKYWDHAPYLGLGPSAHSFDGRTRSWNERSLLAWQGRLDRDEPATAGRETLDDDALLLETIMLRLRTRDGLDLDAVRGRFGVDLLAANRALVERLEAENLIELSGSRLRPTLLGLAVADSLAASFDAPSRHSQWQDTLR